MPITTFNFNNLGVNAITVPELTRMIEYIEISMLETSDLASSAAWRNFEDYRPLELSHLVELVRHLPAPANVLRAAQLPSRRIIPSDHPVNQALLASRSIRWTVYEDFYEEADYWAHKADRKSTRLNSSHSGESRMPSSA